MAKRQFKVKPNTNTQKKHFGVKKRILTKPQVVQDARQKLIQKKRNTVVDARDVLAKMAKTQDARSKINNLRQKRGGAPAGNGNVKVIGSNILQKTDRNGKISLVTNKSKGNAKMNTAIKKELGLVTKAKPPVKRPAAQAKNQRLREAVLNELNPRLAQQMSIRNFEPNLYKWNKPALRTTASKMIGSLENRMRIAEMDNFQAYHTYPTSTVRVPRGYIDLDVVMDDEEMAFIPQQTISLQGSSRVSNVHSRLDGIPREPETHGILAQPKTKVVVPAGHRIVVSNLQSSVTQDDVKELFEDIGQLLAARLVRPGVAEVIYKNLKDAQKAVDTYHNRQLDGQPMKCLLVNKRPFNNPTALPVSSKFESRGLVSSVQVKPAVSNKLVPDLSTIHKVLFQRK